MWPVRPRGERRPPPPAPADRNVCGSAGLSPARLCHTHQQDLLKQAHCAGTVVKEMVICLVKLNFKKYIALKRKMDCIQQNAVNFNAFFLKFSIYKLGSVTKFVSFLSYKDSFHSPTIPNNCLSFCEKQESRIKEHTFWVFFSLPNI